MDKAREHFVIVFLKRLAHEIEFAVERGLDSLDKPLSGDVDIVIRKCDFPKVVEAAEKAGLLLLVTIAYGGARLFLWEGKTTIRRIDLMWRVHFRGIQIGNVEELIRSRTRDVESGVDVLPTAMQAKVVDIIKNAYGGAAKYRVLLEANGYHVLSPGERNKWLVCTACRAPLKTMIGTVRWAAAYMARIIYPTGVVVSGENADEVTRSEVLAYLFQGRVRRSGVFKALIGGRILSMLAVTRSRILVDLVLAGGISYSEAERLIFAFVIRKRTHVPWLLRRLA